MRLPAAVLAALVCLVTVAACSSGGGHAAPPRDRTSVINEAGPLRTSSPSVTSGPSASLPVRPVARVAPSVPAVPDPCVHNTSGKLVKVSVARQHLWMCDATTVAYSTPITSGVVGQYTSTPTGHYRIQGINRNTTLTILGGRQYDVKYWIPFDAPLYGFHDSSWQTFPYGSAKYRTDGSHGCVHMPLTAIRYLAHWASIGTRVVIR